MIRNHPLLSFVSLVLILLTANQTLGVSYTTIDLTPSGFENSYAFGTNGTQQVGWGLNGSTTHALLWNGSAESFIDLHQYLSTAFVNSRAMGIDEDGTIVGWGEDEMGLTQAILWQPIPEPASFSFFALIAILAWRKTGRFIK